MERENEGLRMEITNESEDWMDKLNSLQSSLQTKEARMSKTSSEEARRVEMISKKTQELERKYLDLTKKLFAFIQNIDKWKWANNVRRKRT